MGTLTSRQNAGAEEIDVASIHAYKYPPKSGNYFGSHFIMGGERFDTPQPEAYLFGENADLNFLGSRPTPFPYPPPQANEPTKTLKSLVNIRKESLRLVKVLSSSVKGEAEIIKNTQFNIEFMFDCDSRTSITIYYFATEEITPNGVVYNSKEPSITSETYHYKRGANQVFCQPSHIFDPSKYSDEDMTYSTDKEVIPIAIHCVAQEGPEDTRQSHTTVAIVEKHSDGSYVLKALKQKIFVDGLSYLLQEIYGIENKNQENLKSVGSDVETEDNGSECVICMCDVRDTLILPCRHLCLCNSCADSLRYQANNCPICRAPFRALLQIRALQKGSQPTAHVSTLPTDERCEHIPPGYEAVSLIEALNGPCLRVSPPIPSQPVESSDTPESEVPLNRTLERSKPNKTVETPNYEGDCACPTPEVRMSVLLAREEEESKEKDISPLLSVRRRDKQRHKDSVKTVDETCLNNEEAEDVDSEAEKLSPLLSGREERVEEVVPRRKRWDSGGSRSEERKRNSSRKESKESEDEVCLPSPTATPNVSPVEEQMDQVALVSPPPPTTPPPHTIVHVVGGHSTNSIVVPPPGDDSDYYTPEDPSTTILSPLHTPMDKDSITRWQTSYPGTPLSIASHRSSADSYSSSGSTRHLLSDRTNFLRSST